MISKSRKKGGAQGRIRTTDTRIFSPLLYQLSYLGAPLIIKIRATPQLYLSRPGRRLPEAAYS